MLFSIVYCAVYIILVLKFVSTITKGYCRSNVCLVGKTAVITGGNSGMGYKCALSLASRGCRVIIADVADATESVKQIIDKTGNSNITYMHIDLGSLASVRKFAASLRESEQRLDILINNAGCAGFNYKTDDGVYKVLQINYLGHFLLTHLLSSLLKSTKHSRVVFVSSLLAFTHDLKSGDIINKLPNTSPQLNGIYAYGNSKAAMLAAVNIFAARLQKHGVTVAASHPGLVDTGIFQTAFDNEKNTDLAARVQNVVVYMIVKLFGKSPFEGIQSTLYCALASKVQPGDFIVDCHRFPKPRVLTNDFCQQVWSESLRLASITKEEELSCL